MSFIILKKWTPRNIKKAKKAIVRLVDKFSPEQSFFIEFHERPPGFYGAEDPMRQRGEIAWKYKGLE